MFETKIIFTAALLLSLLIGLVPEAAAGPTIRQAILGHTSMSKSRCLNIAKNICKAESDNCGIDEGSYVFGKDYSIGIQCSMLGRNILIMVIFGAVENDSSEQKFNDLFMRLNNRAAPFFR